MSESKEQEEIKIFIPELTLEITRSALIHVTINNIKEYWKHNSFDLPIRSCLRLFYGFHQSNHQILSEIKIIQVGRITRDGEFYLKPPLFLCGYKLSISISAINRKTEKFMDKSQIYITNIPSIWSLNEYKIGDEVVFKEENEAITRDATIVEVVADNKYKLKYLNNKTFEETECEQSRIFSQCPNIRFTIYLTNNSDCIRYLLLKRNDEQSMNIYNAIKEGLSDNSAIVFECISMYRFDILIHLEPITDFISYNIIGYLCEPSFNHSIHCLFDVKHNKTLKFVNEMQYLYELAIEMGGMSMDTLENLNCSCDLCRTEISEWSFMFCDQTCITEAHQYCMNCILSTILLNKELKYVLHQALEDELNVDCIDEIVNYLIGSVVYTDLECKKIIGDENMNGETQIILNKRFSNKKQVSNQKSSKHTEMKQGKNITTWVYCDKNKKRHEIVFKHTLKSDRNGKSKRVIKIDGKSKYSDKNKEIRFFVKHNSDKFQIDILHSNANESGFDYRLLINGVNVHNVDGKGGKRALVKNVGDQGVELKNWMRKKGVFDMKLYAALLESEIDTSMKIKQLKQSRFDAFARKFRADRFAETRDQKGRNHIDKMLIKFEKVWRKETRAK
eukprot:267791_1